MHIPPPRRNGRGTRVSAASRGPAADDASAGLSLRRPGPARPRQLAAVRANVLVGPVHAVLAWGVEMVGQNHFGVPRIHKIVFIIIFEKSPLAEEVKGTRLASCICSWRYGN